MSSYINKKLFRIEYRYTTNINSIPEKIWKVLTNSENFVAWNSTISSFKGEIKTGNKLELTTPLSPGKVFNPKIKEMIPNEWMLWSNGNPFSFTVQRGFLLKESNNGSTAFTATEKLLRDIHSFFC